MFRVSRNTLSKTLIALEKADNISSAEHDFGMESKFKLGQSDVYAYFQKGIQTLENIPQLSKAKFTKYLDWSKKTVE